MASAYLALVIITRIDHIFLPGNELAIADLPGGGVVPLPGVDTEGESGGDDPINILVMGVDRRPREGDGPSRTDTIFILHVNPKSKRAAIMGIPRDLMVDIPLESGGTHENRINTVYVEGELNGYPGGGVQLMKDTIARNFVTTDEAGEEYRIKIDKYVIIDFEGFEEIIDALGGVDVDVPEYIYDPYYSESELPGDYDPIEFEPGRHHMDGATALAYSRTRFNNSDLDRIQRQQRVIFAAIDKGQELSVLKNAEELWGKYKDAIKTDIDDNQMIGYALLAQQVQDSLFTVSIGAATVSWTTPEGAAVLLGDWDAIGQIVESVFLDGAGEVPAGGDVPVEDALVEVQNGTGEDGLATRVVNYIVTQGYSIDDIRAANAFEGVSREATLVLDLDGTHQGSLYKLVGWLGVDPTQARVATDEERALFADAEAEIIVILGADFDEGTLTASPETQTPDG